MKKKKRVEGDIFEIKLPDGDLAFGRVLPDPLCAFYDLKCKVAPSLDDILGAKVLFKIWVMNHTFWYARWPTIGNRPLEPDLKNQPVFAKVDPITKKLSTYHMGQERPASREEVQGLERAAVWDPEHVESRLSDYFAGRPNLIVERFKV